MLAGTALEARGISKFFPGVKALQDVSLSIGTGSIHALLGENGAGKSTLIKIITGVYKPDEGGLVMAGEPVSLFGTRHAMAVGIGVVHQERNLIPRFSVGENIMLEHIGGSLLKPIRFDNVHRRAQHWLDLLGVDLDPRTPVSELSVAKMQLVEIAKALALRSKVLLLDEPTASLTPHETVAFFALLKRLKGEGVGMLFVSHKLEEVQEICDAVTVLRDGRNACASRSMEGLGRQDLVRLMIGRGERIPDRSVRSVSGNPMALELRGVATPLGHAGIDLSVRKGEIVGIYGLVGAGRTELAKAIIGLFPGMTGSILVAGKPVTITDVADAIHTHRIGYVSEDRKQEGLVLMHSVLDNAGITLWRRLASRIGLLADRRVRASSEPYIRKLEVRTPSLDQTVGNLSGGNQQKISVAKWLAAGIDVLIVDEPSVGIDIKTKAYLHQLLRELAESGTAVLLITSDMPEMIALAGRIAVMDGYQLKGEIANTRVYDDMSEGIMSLIHADASRPSADEARRP